MAANEIHKDDYGTVFTITIKDGDSAVDISAATIKKLIFQDPDGRATEKDAEFSTDGSDGIITYTTKVGDLYKAGLWKLQARITGNTGTWSSDIDEFTVYDNLFF